MYQDNSYKTCIILNKKAPLWSTLNGAFHAALALGQRCKSELDMQTYTTKDKLNTEVSRYPVIIFRGRHQDLKRCYIEAVNAEIQAFFFLDSMVAESLEAQQLATSHSTLACSELLAVAVNGPTEALSPLTKRLSLLGSNWI